MNITWILSFAKCKWKKETALFVASNQSKARSSANKTENEMNIVRIEIFFMNEWTQNHN